MKKQLAYKDYNVVFDDYKEIVDDSRTQLLQDIEKYAEARKKRIKVVFFNGVKGELGVSFFYKKT